MRYVEVEIRIKALVAAGYPVEVSCDEQIFPIGYLRPNVLPWVPSLSNEASGERLFGLLFADAGPQAGWAMAGASPARRVRLRIDNDAPELHGLPWELLRDPAEGAAPQMLAADADTPFSRFLAVKQPGRPPLEERPIKVLAAVASPTNLADFRLGPLDTVAEQQAIADAFAAIPDGEVSLTFVPQPVSLAALEGWLGKGFHVLHLVAHGMRPAEGAPTIFLADAANRVDRSSDTDLAALLERRGSALRLVVLASCETASGSAADALRGFAPRLVDAGVPAVVAMQDRMPVAAARVFSAAFYRQLFVDGQVDLAGNVGRSALLGQGADDSYATPVVFSRVPGGQLFTRRRPLWRRIAESKPARVAAALLAVLSTVAMLVGLAGDLRPYCQPGGLFYPICRLPAPALPVGFNIVVSEFATQSEQGMILGANEASRTVSALLFHALDSDTDLDASTAPPTIRGPLEAGALRGGTRADYEAAAVRAAEEQNATIFVYGLLIQDGTDARVDLAFYVRDPGFSFGGEVAGPGRMGPAVPIVLPLDDASLAGQNDRLRARVDALRRIVAGLGEFRVGNYDAAYARFFEATRVARWRDEEGKEIAYLLMGAARLRKLSPQLALPERRFYLDEADSAFARAQALNPQYARSHLGLGAVAMGRADIARLAQEPEERATLAALLETVRQHYSAAQSATDQPAGAFVTAKADYGLAQVYLLGVETQHANASLSEASAAFGRVVATYTSSSSLDLLWLAGNAHGQLAYIASLGDDWTTMAEEGAAAIALLERMPGNKPRAYIALYWSYIGFAERRRNDLQACRDAYERAINIGTGGVVSEHDLAVWREQRSCS